MTQQHPISLSPELVQQWWDDSVHFNGAFYEFEAITATVFQAGADQELEACCEWLKLEGHEHAHEALLTARRPKPPSLKEQALQALDRMDQLPTAEDQHIIRHALEQLND